LVYEPDSGTLIVIKVKTGDARLTPNQEVVYPDIADGTATMNATQLQQLELDPSFSGQPISNIFGTNIIVEEVRR